MALTLRFQDVISVDKSVESSAGEPFASKDFGPVLEWKVRGHDIAVEFTGCGDHIEDEFRSCLAGRGVTQFVEDAEGVAEEGMLLVSDGSTRSSHRFQLTVVVEAILVTERFPRGHLVCLRDAAVARWASMVLWSRASAVLLWAIGHLHTPVTRPNTISTAFVSSAKPKYSSARSAVSPRDGALKDWNRRYQQYRRLSMTD
jgi:hypothetical protein